ncbi:DUF7222 domain-containing protein [Campylobacter vicugnae]|uniref:DUF7222 domain-containing protein n=1 Tax=Campylobacter vicugnae TaxID=1660076 RepID=UPI000A35AE16|nr:hypothetical protein [Campylobacter sp. RM9262]
MIIDIDYSEYIIDKEGFIKELEDRGYSTAKEIFDYLGDDIEEILYKCKDIVVHGIESGFGSFIYYSDTTRFYKDNEEEILKHLTELTDSVYDDEDTSLVTWLYRDEVYRLYLEEMLLGDPARLYNLFTWTYVQDIITRIMGEDDDALLDYATSKDEYDE